MASDLCSARINYLQIDPPATPEEGYHFRGPSPTSPRDHSSADAKAIDPDKPFFMHQPAGGAMLHHNPRWADKYKGKFDEGYEQDGGDPRLPEGAGPAAGGDRARADRHPACRSLREDEPHGKPWPGLDTVRPWTADEDEQRPSPGWRRSRRLFLRRTDHHLAGLITWRVRQPRTRRLAVAGLSNGAGAGRSIGSFNEWRFFNASWTQLELTWPASTSLEPVLLQPRMSTTGLASRCTPFLY